MGAMRTRVVPLDQLDDFKVADGDPDVRGWTVMGPQREKIGDVHDLIVDTNAMKVRYLDVRPDRKLRSGRTEEHLLIPIGYARLDQSDNEVFLDTIEPAMIEAMPGYRHDQPITTDYEVQLRSALDRDFESRSDQEGDFYTGPLFDEDRFYGRGRDEEARIPLAEEELAIGRRERRAGQVEVDKEIDTRHVRESVPVRKEEVVVERGPATGMAGEARIEGGEVRIPVEEEELVVDKRTVPREEVVVKKREVVEEETVEADLRRERAEVHRRGEVDVDDRS